MTALDFPSSPSNGQEFEGYIWNATKGVWDSNSGLDFNITDLADVDTTGVVDGDALVYDEATSSWIPGEGSSASITVSDTPPSAPESGNLWLDSITGNTYIYYSDYDNDQWVQTAGPNITPNRGANLIVSSTAPPSPVSGDLWYDPTEGYTYLYYVDEDSSQWVQFGLNRNGSDGETGTNGSDGVDGVGVPAGGASGQRLAKASNADYDTEWVESETVYDSSSSSSGFFALPVGGDADRPVTPANGYVRFNTDSGEPEYYSEAESSWFLFRQEASLFPVSVEYLVIAGGGGANRLAGAGAGGYRSSVSGESSGGGASAESALSLSAGTYTVTVGAGGAGAENVGAVNGSSSVFSTISCTGGGYAGPGGSTDPGGSGGSGGGAWPSQNGGSGTTGEGFDGGDSGPNVSPNRGGGGGGASEAGGNGGSSPYGVGGDGVASSITGSSVYRSGGGAGSDVNASVHSGGLGGGGTSGGNSVGEAGAANTGGGGASGGGGSGSGGAGGSGIVIIKYPSTITATPTVGLTSTTSTVGDYKVTQFTAGTGTVTFS